MATQASPAPRRSKLGRIALFVLLPLFLLIVLAVALLPTIASWFAPGIVRSASANALNGEAEVQKVRLSWTGPQQVQSLRVKDASGREVLNADVRVSSGLLPLVFGSRDLGEILVSGSAVVVRGQDGSINIADLAKPDPTPKPPSAEPAKLPSTLAARLVVNALSVTFIDETRAGSPAAAVGLWDIKGDAAFAVGKPVTAAFRGNFVRGADQASAKPDGGTLALDATLNNLTASDGTLTPLSADGDVKLAVHGLDTVTLDTLLAQEGRLADALGKAVTLDVQANGSAQRGTATLAASSDALNADIALALADNRVTLPRPGVITARTGRLIALAPDLAARLGDERTMVVQTWPDVTATLESLALAIPQGGPLDLRGTSARATLATTDTAGKVAIPGAGGTHAIQPFALAPLAVTLDAPDLAGPVTLSGGTRATISGQSAGAVSIDARANGLLDGAGAPRAGLPAEFQATIALSDLATAIIEPLVANPSIRLAEDVGPTLNARIAANVTPTPGSDKPNADADLSIESANLRARGGVTLINDVLATKPDGIALAIASAGPLAERFLTTAGLDITSGASVEASIRDLRADLARLSGPDGPDLRALSALASVTLGPTAGAMKLGGDAAPTPFQTQPFTVAIDASDLARAVTATTTGSAILGGQPAGTLDAQVSASILDANGAPVTGIPANLEGRFTLLNASTRALQPFVASTGLVLPEDIGDTLNVEGWAKPGAEPGRTDVSMAANARKLQLSAQLDVSPTEFRTREQGVVLTVQEAGRILSRFAPPEQASFEPAGSVRLLAQNVAIPMDAASGKPRLDRTAAQVTFSASDLRAALRTPDGPARPFTLATSRLGLTLVPKGKPHIGLESRMSIDGKPSVAQGSIKLNNLFASDGSINAAGVRPEGTLELADVPTVLAALARPDMAALVTEALGPTVNAALAANPAANDPAAVDVGVRVTSASGTALTTTARMTPDEIAVGAVQANAAVTPRLLTTLAKGNPAAPRLSAPAAVNLAVEPFAIPLKGTGVDAARIAGRRVKAVVTADARIEDLVVGQGAEAMRTGPVALQGFRLVADAPLAALTPESAAARATATIDATLATLTGDPLAVLAGNADLGLKGSAPSGPVNANIRLDNVSGAFLDRFLNKPELVSGAVGERFQAAASVALPNFPSGEDLRNLGVNVKVNSGRFTMSDVATIRLSPDRVVVAKPVTIDWKPTPSWATRYMLGAEPGTQTPPPLRFTQPLPVRIELAKASIARGSGAESATMGPLKPGIFDLDVALAIASAQMAMHDGTALALRDLSANVAKSQNDPTGVTFRLRTVPAAAGNLGEPVTLNGSLTRLADNAGVLTPDAASLTAKGRVADFPTVLVDALAQQNGLLVEFLGPLVNMDLDAQDFSRQSGRLSAKLDSQRASALVQGTVRNGLFVADPATGANVRVITAGLGEALVKSLPLVGSIEKRPEDAPAALKTSRLEIPLGVKSPQDLRRLNASLTADLGELRFTTGGAFQQVLKVIRQKDQGTAGRRLQPLQVNINEGVVRYDRFTIPLGEFNVDTEGTYDLVTGQVDFLTWIPAGALADEAAGVFNTGLGGLLGGAVTPVESLTMLPWRTRGTAGAKLETKPDLKLFLESTGKQLLRPDRLIEGGLQDIFNKLPGNRDKDD